MKLNTDKCHLIIAGKKYEHTWAKLGEELIWEENTVKPLGLTIDSQLKFDKAVVKNILVCRQPTGSYLMYRVKLFLSVFFLYIL